MKLTGPYLTLAGGLTVAGVLFAASANAVRVDQVSSANPPAAAIEPVGGSAETQTPSQSPTSEPEPAESEAVDPTPSEGEPTAEPTEAAEIAPSGTYAGSVKGGGASVAIAIKGDTAIAYVCDGKEVESWLKGAADTAPLSLTGKGGAKLTADFVDNRLVGTIKVDGEKWTFKVKKVKAPSGLYRAAANVRSAKVVGGWIIYEGQQVGMFNRSTGSEAPAPEIDLKTGKVTIDGEQLQATAVDGSPLE